MKSLTLFNRRYHIEADRWLPGRYRIKGPRMGKAGVSLPAGFSPDSPDAREQATTAVEAQLERNRLAAESVRHAIPLKSDE